MSGSLKLGLIIIATVLGLRFAWHFIGSLVAFLTPIAIIAGIGLILYGVAGRKALGGSRRRYLP